ncbi:MAG: hypothetical protein HY954_07690 [Deltaproteobacteria bacterium]|nr:hypothetical protein [Deltaproteobacteria bacterium]
MWIAGVLLAFILPVIYIVVKEWRSKKESEKGDAPKKKKEPISYPALGRLTVLLFILLAPALYFSDVAYTFYKPEDAGFKIAFKHTGRRVTDCEEADIIKKAGERYRKELKDSRQVKMNIGGLAHCPRERFPVVVEFYMDDKKMLDKAYAPTGFKKDMASYIYEEFIIEPGLHKFSAKLYRSGPNTPADYTFEDTVELKSKEIKVIRFDEKSGMLLMN